MRGGLGQVRAAGMYNSIGHVKFPKFKTGIFSQWKAPREYYMNIIFEIFAKVKFNLCILLKEIN